MSQTSYAFGDCDAARERLDLLGQVFDRASRAFLAAAAEHPPPSAARAGHSRGAAA
jgi:hypothetical protein